MTASWTQWDSYQICTLVYKSCTWSEATLLQKRMQHISHSSIEAVSSTVNFQHNITNGTCKKIYMYGKYLDSMIDHFFVLDKRDGLVQVMSHQRVIAQSVFENSSHDCFISIKLILIWNVFVEVSKLGSLHTCGESCLISHVWWILSQTTYWMDLARKKIDLYKLLTN